MKIVLSGIYYPVAILRYFEAALRRRTDVELFTVGPYTGNKIPWNGGVVLPEKYARRPDLVIPGGVVSVATVEAKLPWKPDLWLQIDAGFYLFGKPHCPNFFVGTDPHCLNYDKQRLLADKFFCMQTPYAKQGDVWLPYAYDPVWHAPRTPQDTQPIIYDAALVGVKYAERVRWIHELRKRNHSVLFENGPSYDEARHLYLQAKIGLNWSSLKDLCARVFEVSALGLCPVINKVPDLDTMGWVDGTHYLGFTDLDGAIRAFELAIERHQDVSKQAQAFVQPHTWDARVGQILQHYTSQG